MREYRFDIARVICMTYIVTYVHLYEYIYPHDQSATYFHVCVAMAHACLGVFTFVSGYLLGKKYCFGQQGNADVLKFYEKRILRVIPLFVVASILLWMVDFNDADSTLNGLLCISPFVNPKPRTTYYIPIILWCYLVTPLVSRRSLKWRVGACLSLFGLLVAARCMVPSIDPRMVFNVFFFFVGIVSACCFDWKLNTSYGKVIKTIAGLTLVLLMAAAIHFSLSSTSWQMVVGAMGVLVILFVCEDMCRMLFDGRSRHGGFKAFVAKIISLVSYASMACYMFHRFFYWMAERIWNPSDAYVKWIYMVGVVFPVILVISYVIQKLYDGLVKKKEKTLVPMLLFVVLSILGFAAYHFVDKEFMVAKELPYYHVSPRSDDDTIRVAVIGDSWAHFHKTFSCDALFEQYAGRWTPLKVKCQSRGKGGALSKEVYHLMFRNQLPQNSWWDDFCTQPLIEEHPDYCVVMTGINDTWKKRPVSYYAGNCRHIIRLLLANDIRPVVMEIPDFEMGKWLDTNRRPQRFIFRIYSYFTDVVEDDITPFRKGLKDMLNETGFVDSILYIPADNWLPKNHHYSEDIYNIDHIHLNYQGYHLLDSCMASEIIKDYHNRILK